MRRPMPSKPTTDFAIIGGGIVGRSTLRHVDDEDAAGGVEGRERARAQRGRVNHRDGWTGKHEGDVIDSISFEAML